MGIFLLLCLSVYLVGAGITRWEYTMVPGDILNQRSGIFAASDNPLPENWAHPSVKVNLTVELEHQRVNKPDFLEVILLHHSMKREIGFYDSSVYAGTEYCCTAELFGLGLCQNLNKIIVKNLSHAIDQTFKFHYITIPASWFHNHKATLNTQWGVEITGMYYLYVANCDQSSTQTNIKVEGDVTWTNPYGFLPGEIATKLPVYWTLSACYIVLLFTISVMGCYYNKNLMWLQIATIIVIIICMIEQLVWSGALVFYNFQGWSSLATTSVGALLTAFKATAIRVLLLLVALGLSITSPRLSGIAITGIVVITVVYFAFRAASEYTTVSIAVGTPQQSSLGVPIFAIAAGLFITNIVFFGWIVLATYISMTLLDEQKQTAKSIQYLKLGILLVIALAISGFILILQGAAATGAEADEYFKWWWAWDAYWEFVYFICVMSIAAIWHPSVKNELYAYSTQLPQDGEDNDARRGSDEDQVPLDDLDTKTQEEPTTLESSTEHSDVDN